MTSWDQARARARGYVHRAYKAVKPVEPVREYMGLTAEGHERWRVGGTVCTRDQLNALYGRDDDETCTDCGHVRCSCKVWCEWCDENVDHVSHDEDACRLRYTHRCDEYRAEERHRQAQQALHPSAAEHADRLISDTIAAYVHRNQPIPSEVEPEMVVRILDRWCGNNLDIAKRGGLDQLERTRVLQWNAARRLWKEGDEAKFCAGLGEYNRLRSEGFTERQIVERFLVPVTDTQPVQVPPSPYKFPVQPGIEHGQTALRPSADFQLSAPARRTVEQFKKMFGTPA